MSNTNVFFSEVGNGYDREQVDNYVRKLTEAYQVAYEENTVIAEKYNSLEEAYNKISMQERKGTDSDISMMYVELMAKKIIADAQVRAAQAKAEAQKTLTEANKEAAQKKAEAQQMIDEANTEAVKIVIHAKKNLEQAHEIMEQTVGNMQSLLAFNMPNNKSVMAG